MGFIGRLQERLVDPYRLACLDGAWYLAAFCHKRREVRLFVPDRMKEAAETGETFPAPRDFDFEKYMAGAFRVLRGAGRPRRVRLLFRGRAARLAAERRWHATQRVIARRDGCVLEFSVTALEEVASWAMSFGGDCKVLAPEELRQMVAGGHWAGWQENGGGKAGKEGRK